MTGFQLPNQSDRLIESFGVGAEGDWISLTPPFTWRLGGLAVKNPSFTGGSWSLAEVGDGLAEVIGGDVGAEEGVAGGADEDEADGAGDEFLVVGEAVQDRFGGDGIRQDERQAEVVEERDDAVGVGLWQAGEVLRQEDGGAEAEGDGLAVEDLAIGEGGFDAVADGVAEIEQGAEAEGFVFVGFDDAGLDGDVAGDEAGGDFAAVGVEVGEFVEVQGSGEEAVFSEQEMSAMLALSRKGIDDLVSLQKQAILTADRAAPADFSSLAAAFSPSR